MRTTLKATIALSLSLLVLLVAAAAGAQTNGASSPAAVGPTAAPQGDGGQSGGGSGQSVPGWDGSGEAPLPAEPVDPIAPSPCGQTVASGSGPDGTVAFAPCPGQEPPIVEPAPQVVVPTPGMADVYARPFDTATVGPDGVTVAINFVSGVEPCYVLDHVDVTYGADTVTITLFEGHDGSSGDVACIEIGVYKRVVITLDEPIGDRAIVDGAAQR